MSVFILGSTGLVGRSTLVAANKAAQIETIATVSRRSPQESGPKIKSFEEKDSAKWPEVISAEGKGFKAFISAFGTTRANAGSAENFKKIDYGINYEAAKAAKEAGVETFVLVSTLGANANSFLLYSSTKGKLEDDIIKLQFPRTVILRPGVLFGARETSKGYIVGLAESFARSTRNTPLSFVVRGIDGDHVGQIAVQQALEPFTPGSKPVVKIIEASQMAELAKKL